MRTWVGSLSIEVIVPLTQAKQGRWPRSKYDLGHAMIARDKKDSINDLTRPTLAEKDGLSRLRTRSLLRVSLTVLVCVREIE
ncbi:hypothetical protein B296_00000171 [Ensete ventricosum]|uniref:Uncharacterized protein n=1 Tax=Ensete ventricosum TaxID=4639 RepID=A0A426Z412_ENSVE|nr:hypothetical protein B296_00000171 [Ensete ventricosum]